MLKLAMNNLLWIGLGILAVHFGGWVGLGVYLVFLGIITKI